jgi:hypothetical protein
MKKSTYKYLGLAFCVLSITLAGNVLAARAEEALDKLEEQADQPTAKDDRDKDCHLFFLKRDLGVQEAGMEAGEPINTLQLFITGADGKIIKNAQFIATIIDQQGHQQLTRALPFKGGYMLAIDHLATGQYLVEAEIVTPGRLLKDLFRFNKA